MSKARELSKLPNYVLSTVAELKLAVGKEQGDKAFVGGYYENGDGGGGDFYWDAVSIEADNGGTIFQVTGTTTGRWKRIYSGSVSVKWFGAKGDGVTDDTVAINNCIKSFNNIYIPKATFMINSPLYVLTKKTYIIDYATFVTSSNTTLFETGSIVGGAFVSNYLLPDRTVLIERVNLSKFYAIGFDTVLKLNNTIDQCIFSDISTLNCDVTLNTINCYYSSFKRITHRQHKDPNSTNAAFNFLDFNNIEAIESLAVTGKKVGWKFFGQSNALKITNSSAEGCETGVILSGAGVVNFDTFYSEFNATSFDFSGVNSTMVCKMDGCFFFQNDLAFKSANRNLTLYIPPSNKFVWETVENMFSGFLNNEMVIYRDSSLPYIKNINEAEKRVLAQDFLTPPTQTSDIMQYGVLLDDTSNVKAKLVTSPKSTSTVLDFLSSSPSLQIGSVLACNHYASNVLGTTTKTFGVMIETSIPYVSNSSQILTFNFSVVLDSVTKNFYGFIFGNKVVNLGDTGFTIQHSPASGLNRFFIYTFSTSASAGLILEGQPTGYTCTGLIRHV
jgi:hypothetical protein